MMRKDETIAHHFYHLPSYTYQCARFTDWFRPYLSEQLADAERSHYVESRYLRNKCELLRKALAHLDALEPIFAEYAKAQNQQLDKCLAGGQDFSDLKESWVGVHNTEVIRSYPPRLIVGKCVGEEREVYVYDQDPLVRVQIFELDCEYAYSAPTGRFNLQVPHLGVKINYSATETYAQYKKEQALLAAAADKQEDAELEPEERLAAEQAKEGQGNAKANAGTEEADGEKTAEDVTQDWEQTKKQGPVVLKVVLTNKTEDKDLKVWYRLSAGALGEEALNMPLSLSKRKTYLSTRASKFIELLVKVDPSKPYFCTNFADLKVEIEATVRNTAAAAQERGQRRVHYAVPGGVVGHNQDIDDDEDREDDGHAFDPYQSDPPYDAYQDNGNDAGLL